MAQPTPYDRQYSFRQWQAQYPSDPLPGDELDNELNAVKASLDETQSNLARIQRDDGELANASVGLDQLKAEVSIGVEPAVAWAPDTDFSENQSVFYNLILYRCIEAHTSGDTFDSGKFVELADLTSIVTPPGSIDTEQLADDAVESDKIADGAVTPSKIGTVAASSLLGRHSGSVGSAQAVSLGSGLTFSAGALAWTGIPDGAITTSKIYDASVTSGKLAAGVAVANLGYTPVNKAGDTISGALNFTGEGRFLFHNTAFQGGRVYVDTASPSGGADGEIWLQYS